MGALFGHLATFTQDKNKKIDLLVFGDEFNARYFNAINGGQKTLYEPESPRIYQLDKSAPGLPGSQGIPAVRLPYFRLTDLGTLDGNGNSVAGAVNAHGHVIGRGDWGFDTPEYGFLWRSGANPQMEKLATLGGTSSGASDINNQGQIVGFADDSDQRRCACIWENGVIKSIGDLGGGRSYAYSINDAGQIVGESRTAANQNQWHAFVWTPGATDGVASNPQMKDIGTLGGHESTAACINASGSIVGVSHTANGDIHAFLYTPGGNPQMQDLGTLGGRSSFGCGVNDAGNVVGMSTTANGELYGYLWSPGGTAGPASNPRMMRLDPWGKNNSFAAAISGSGLLVGAAPTPHGDTRGYLYKGRRFMDVGTIGKGSSEAYGLNDTGLVVGKYNTNHSDHHAFIATPLKPSERGRALLTYLRGLGLKAADARTAMAKIKEIAELASHRPDVTIWGLTQELNALIPSGTLSVGDVTELVAYCRDILYEL
jgi:probable HAF family extracellular repeat protein